MKQFLFLLLSSIIALGLSAQGVTKHGEHAASSANFVDKNGKLNSIVSLDKNGRLVVGVAPTGLTINHTAGTVAPVTKTVTYGTVTTSITGASKTWITQNLGSTNQASSATDITEASAGWYFQFNRKQGYKNDGTTRTPGSTWITSIDENSEWTSANDPCTIELGTGWRLPINVEWTAVDASWATYNDSYSSVLKAHTGGYLLSTSGGLSQGGCACYWSSTQSSTSAGNYVGALSSSSIMYAGTKAYGFPVRCIKDEVSPSLTINHTAGTVAPVTKTVTYGTVVTSLSGASKTWITQNLGASSQASSATDATDAAAGWYFQFNRKQGYQSSGGVRTPNTTWITAINESANWAAVNDPCNIELGNGWRIPTNTEWTNVDANGSWGSSTDSYNSVLKIHAAGLLQASDGSSFNRGSYGYYWSSVESSATNGYLLDAYYNVSGNNKAYGFSVRCIKDDPSTTLTITHTAGAIAPVTKTISYGLVTTNLSGANKTWITQNLGSTNQASSASDATEPPAGWYFQFNLKQGYKHDGSTRTPNSTWTTSISESADWLPANDPCTIELGTGWRIPTNGEWTAVNTTGGWAATGYNTAYSSVLKLHASGYLNETSGSRVMGCACNWSSTQSSTSQANYIGVLNTNSAMYAGTKAYAFTLRCIKDSVAPVAPTSGLIINHTAGTTAPVNKTVTYGTVVTNLTGSNKTWITQNLGATNQATIVTDITEPSHGWYFQFNRKQGYKHDGTTRTPNSAWTTSISESSDWVTANDPCTIELGTGWRIPTGSEWVAVDANGAWNNHNDAFSSVLKLHAPGNYLDLSSGALMNQGVLSSLWAATQSTATTGVYFGANSSGSAAAGATTKAYGLPVRCLNDDASLLMINHTAGTVAPVTKTVQYKTVTTSLSGSSKLWLAQNLGATNQASSVSDATEAAVGWYFQFNRKQGYKHDGTTRTPNSTWITTIDEAVEWTSANDPCTIELGAGWRIPTNTEWVAVRANGGWSNGTDAYNSVLKMHTSVTYLNNADGTFKSQSPWSSWWASTQTNSANGAYITVSSGAIQTAVGSLKAYALPVRCLKDDASTTLTITHTAGTVAPVSKTVNYGLVTTSLSGSNKTWITQNLGASNQATSATDATEPSAGWYFQFNRKQGYKHDGTTRTPGTAWITSINESSDWVAANDPCTIELGAGWRIPTDAEWTAVGTNGGWSNYNSAYSSVLKMHASGYVGGGSAGSLGGRGSTGYFWSATQGSATNGMVMSYSSSLAVGSASVDKYGGYTLRCLKDATVSPLTINHTAGTVAPVNKTVTYGTVVTNLSGATKTWITQNLGSTNQATSATDGTEAAYGWFFQFNRKQGYKHDGSTRTPNTAWVTTINDNADWAAANDPCTIELGTGWRIPTNTEWTAVDANGSWNSAADAYNSVLKIHIAYFLNMADGSLGSSSGNYWSSTQGSAVNKGRFFAILAGSAAASYDDVKHYGFSIRCIKD